MVVLYIYVMFVFFTTAENYYAVNNKICSLNYFMKILSCICDSKFELRNNEERKKVHLHYAVDHCCKFSCSELFLKLYCPFKNSEESRDYLSKYISPEYVFDENIIAEICKKNGIKYNKDFSTRQNQDRTYSDFSNCRTVDSYSGFRHNENIDTSVSIPDDEDYSIIGSSGFSSGKGYSDESSGILNDETAIH
ncbi:uncharacterized protein LOC111617692 [Centruroides sculpturatus]|uniref:uncharacterized protein LOC111617692 n=1 Tax=Centruroides sculpturatus TaxID=218467 RepID=UPI000C6CA372|nr:uncharacterized protein LOC111617692 [Centruroides sculpturatus]